MPSAFKIILTFGVFVLSLFAGFAQAQDQFKVDAIALSKLLRGESSIRTDRELYDALSEVMRQFNRRSFYYSTLGMSERREINSLINERLEAFRMDVGILQVRHRLQEVREIYKLQPEQVDALNGFLDLFFIYSALRDHVSLEGLDRHLMRDSLKSLRRSVVLLNFEFRNDPVQGEVLAETLIKILLEMSVNNFQVMAEALDFSEDPKEFMELAQDLSIDLENKAKWAKTPIRFYYGMLPGLVLGVVGYWLLPDATHVSLQTWVDLVSGQSTDEMRGLIQKVRLTLAQPVMGSWLSAILGVQLGSGMGDLMAKVWIYKRGFFSRPGFVDPLTVNNILAQKFAHCSKLLKP